MLSPDYDILSDDGLFAGYIDSGIWELEEWLAASARQQEHFRLSDPNFREDSDE